MPCNIGFKETAKIRLPNPAPQKFKKKVAPPPADMELLLRIGEDDPEFLEWMNALDVRPLLEEALRRAQSKIGSAPTLALSITEDGALLLQADLASEKERKNLEKTASLIGNLFQAEVLGIVIQLLDYDTEVTQDGTHIMIEGEKHETGDAPVHKYVRVTTTKEESDGVVMFEHFDSKLSLASEQQKFFALSEKLGVAITVFRKESGGQPIPAGTAHKDFLKRR